MKQNTKAVVTSDTVLRGDDILLLCGDRGSYPLDVPDVGELVDLLFGGDLTVMAGLSARKLVTGRTDCDWLLQHYLVSLAGRKLVTVACSSLANPFEEFFSLDAHMFTPGSGPGVLWRRRLVLSPDIEFETRDDVLDFIDKLNLGESSVAFKMHPYRAWEMLESEGNSICLLQHLLRYHRQNKTYESKPDNHYSTQ